MNQNNTGTIIGTIIIILLIIFGIYYWTTRSVSNTTNINTYNTPSGTTNTNNTNAGVPAVSTKPATFTSQSTAILNGEVNPNGVQTSYWYEYGETNSLGSFTAPQLIGGGSATYGAPRSISGLKPNTTYYFRLAAQNQNGKVYGAVLDLKTTNTAPVRYLPPSVQTRDATSVAKTSASLNGTVNPNGSSTFYWFEYGDNFALGNTTSTGSIATSSVSKAISNSITGLTPNKTYYYRLNAQNAYGTVNGNISVFTTQPENPPSQVGNPPVSVTGTATSITANSALLRGQINPNKSATTYYFLYGKSTLFGLFTLDQKTNNVSVGSIGGLVSVSKTISGLDTGGTYYYQIVAENQYGTTRGSIYSFTTSE